MKTGLELIAEERMRQLTGEGWTSEHDDTHSNGELRRAAECYKRGNPGGWPWDLEWWKPTTEVRNLIKAGALYLAEADRFRRARKPGCAEMMVLESHDCAARIDQLMPAHGVCEWQVHIIGPDDLIPQPDEITALREANRLNIFIAQEKLKHANDPHYPFSMAVVERNGVAYNDTQSHQQCQNGELQPAA